MELSIIAACAPALKLLVVMMISKVFSSGKSRAGLQYSIDRSGPMGYGPTTIRGNPEEDKQRR